MKKNLSLFAAVVYWLFSAAGPLAHADPLMDREGRTLTVTIDGIPTKSIPARDIDDPSGVKPYTVFWSASTAKGPRCFKVATLDARLGKAEKIDILIFEIRPDRMHQNWKSYQAVPSPAESLATFEEGNGFCPKEYILTERLRYPSLPPGDYVLRFAYWGVGNWDRQDILLTVKE